MAFTKARFPRSREIFFGNRSEMDDGNELRENVFVFACNVRGPMDGRRGFVKTSSFLSNSGLFVMVA